MSRVCTRGFYSPHMPRMERWEFWWIPARVIRGFSQESLQFLHRHFRVSQNAAQSSFGDVAAGMNRHGGAAPVRMTHGVVASGTRATLKPAL